MVAGRTEIARDLPGDGELDAQQISGLGDMENADFRAAAHAAVDIMADYLASVGDRPVMPEIEPGSLRPLFPAAPPEAPASIGTILSDYQRLFEPNVTHWQHPRFLAYFSSSASGPGIIGEMLTAVLNSNAMLWRTSPAGTELEQVVVDWLRQGLGLPPNSTAFSPTAPPPLRCWRSRPHARRPASTRLRRVCRVERTCRSSGCTGRKKLIPRSRRRA